MKAYYRDGKKYVPYNLAWDNMPIDLSFLYSEEKPAGKHGFLKVDGDHFAFEDGTEARFFGVNFNSGANFPTHKHSEMVAERLAQTGINLVRFHQMDAEWSLPNLFQSTRGRFLENTRTLDAKSLDRLDYLIYSLKRQGIYIYMDMLTYRRFKTGDGMHCSEKVLDSAKPYANFDPMLIELQKEFARQLWTHENPYTKLRYKDEPAIVLTEILNENDLFHPKLFKIVCEPYRTDLENRYRCWAKERGIDLLSQSIDFEEPDDNILEFFKEITVSYYRDMMSCLRDIGVRIPITGTNWANTPDLFAVQLVTDFTDSHTYWAPNFGDQRKFSNRMMTSEPNTFIDVLSLSRALDRPFFVSEWDEPWPYEWRAESPLFLSAVGAMQGWSGFAIHTYRYGTNENESVTGKIGRDIVIGNSFYRGIFDTYNDPAKYGLFYAAALMFRRGDISESEHRVAAQLGDLKNKEMGMKPYSEIPVIPLSCEKSKFGFLTDGVAAVQDEIVPWDKPNQELEDGCVTSDTGELFRNWKKKYGTIDTQRTKAVYGMIGKQSSIELSGLTIEADSDFATISLSSLTDKEISHSANILLTAVGRADNSGSVFSPDHTSLLDSGKAPVECEVIKAKIKLKTDVSPMRIWSVDDEGYLTGVIPSEYNNGILEFEIGNMHESIYYLIQKQ